MQTILYPLVDVYMCGPGKTKGQNKEREKKKKRPIFCCNAFKIFIVLNLNHAGLYVVQDF